MSRRYAIFDQAQLGPALEIRQGGEVIGIESDGLTANRTALGNIGQSGYTHYLEFVAWGEDDIEGAVGIATADASLSTSVGGDAWGIGYRLEAGEIRSGGVSLATVPVVEKGQVVGVLLQLEGPEPSVSFYLAGELVHTESLAGTAFADVEWFPAASLGSDLEADLQIFLNSGQRAPEFPNASADGWWTVDPTIDAIWIGTEDDTTSATDQPAHQRIDGVVPIGNVSFTVDRQLAFWTDGDSSVTRPSVASLTILDAEGRYDDLISGAVRDLTVDVYDMQLGGTLAGADPIGRYVIDRVQALDDGQKRLILRDGGGKFDDPLQLRLFLPSVAETAANRIWPISLGAVLSMTPVLYDEANLLFAIHDDTLLGLGFVRDRGDKLELIGSPPDYEITPDYQGIKLNSNPAGKLTADVSSVGGDIPVPPTSLAPSTLAGWDESEDVTEIGGGLYRFADSRIENAGTVEAFVRMIGLLEANKTYRYSINIVDKSGFFGGTGQRATVAFFRSKSAGAIPDPPLKSFAEAGSYSGTFTNFAGSARDFYIGLIGTQSGADFAEIEMDIGLYEVTNEEVTSDNLLPIKLADFAEQILQVRGGFDASEWSRESAEDIDTTTGYEGIGWHTAEQVPVRRPMEDVLPGYSTCIAQDREGVFRFYRLEFPDLLAAESPSLIMGEIGEIDMLEDLIVTPDNAPGLTLRFALQRNETVLDPSDFVDDFDPVTGVPLSVRRALGRQYREIVATGGTLASAYRFAYAASPLETRFIRIEDAQAELNRIREGFATERKFYAVEVPLDNPYDLGQLWTLTYSRYSLSGGKPVIIRGITENRVDRTATLKLWG